MPELVACPSCGCKLQLAEMFLGQRTRCIACSGVFVATPQLGPPSAQPACERQDVYPLSAEPAPAPPPAPAPYMAGRARHLLPLCPGCSRPVSWEIVDCPHCGLMLDPLDAEGRGDWIRRRDAESHRGKTIDALGTVAVLAGTVSLCVGPLGLIGALVAGIPALVMARHDLAQMRTGVVDPEGRYLTGFGRNKALVGIVLAILFSVFFLGVLVGRYS